MSNITEKIVENAIGVGFQEVKVEKDFKMSDSEEEAGLLLDPDAIDQIARRHYGYSLCGWCVHGSKCMRNSCMSVDNPAQRMFKNPEKEGGTRIEIDCEKGIMIVRVTKPHSITGKTEMTKVNVDYHTIGRVSSYFLTLPLFSVVFGKFLKNFSLHFNCLPLRLLKTLPLCFWTKLLDHSRHRAEKY